MPQPGEYLSIAANQRVKREDEDARTERLQTCIDKALRALTRPIGSGESWASHNAHMVQDARATLAAAARFNPEAEPKPGHNCDAELKARPDYSPFLGSPPDYTCSCGQRFIYDSDEASGAWWEAVPHAE